jgi:hypothetical protein
LAPARRVREVKAVDPLVEAENRKKHGSLSPRALERAMLFGCNGVGNGYKGNGGKGWKSKQQLVLC